MPAYDFKCEKCEHTFEINLPMKDSTKCEDEPCPECGEEGTVKRFYGETDVSIGDPVRMGIRKPDGSFNEVLHKIHEGTPGSTLDKHRNF